VNLTSILFRLHIHLLLLCVQLSQEIITHIHIFLFHLGNSFLILSKFIVAAYYLKSIHMMDFGCLANMVSVLVKTFLFGKLYQCFILLASFLFLASILLFMLPVHFWRTNMASRLLKLISFVILFRLVSMTFVVLFQVWCSHCC